MSLNEEEELIRLDDIFKTLKKDAVEVTDLIVRGINSYKIVAYVAVAFGLFSLWNLNNAIITTNLLQIIFWFVLSVLFFISGPYAFYKNRQLKKKYNELIEINKSLTED